MPPTHDTSEDTRRGAMRQVLGAVTGLVPVGVIAVDPSGRPWYRSQRWTDLSGQDDREARGAFWYMEVHPDDRAALGQRWGSLVDRRGRLGHFRTISPDGSVRWCQAESIAMVGSSGTVDGYLVVVSDAVVAQGHAGEHAGGAGAAGGNGMDGIAGTAEGPGAPALSTPHLLDAVLESSSDVITILNADGSWRWSNGGAIRLVGHQEGFDPSDGIFSLVHPDDVAAGRRLLARALSEKISSEERFELRVRAADGSWHWMEGILDVLLDDPAIRGVVVHLRDITGRRLVREELEAANRRLVHLIASMHMAVVLVDEHDEVVVANRAFVDLFRLPFSPDDMIGKTLESLGISVRKIVAEPPDAETLLRGIRASRVRTEGVRCVLVDGRTIECDFVPVAVQGVDRGHLSAYRDVTGQARAEAEKERLLASEQDENRRLAELDAYRSESIAAVSHELRTPLTSIVGYTQLLREVLDPSASAESRAALEAIERNVDRLLRLAGDVVALDSLESRAMPLPISSVDVPAVVRRAARTIAPEAVARAIEVTVETETGPAIHGDEDRLAQLFENVLSNAVKFTPEDGRIDVRAAPAGPVRGREAVPSEGPEVGPAVGPAVGPQWAVTVTDSGIGIPEDEIELLFMRFFRASNARRRGIPGSGLGLSIARAIAERHGGDLSVESVVGVGTTVTMRVGSASEHEGADGDAVGVADGDADGDGAHGDGAHGDGAHGDGADPGDAAVSAPLDFERA